MFYNVLQLMGKRLSPASLPCDSPLHAATNRGDWEAEHAISICAITMYSRHLGHKLIGVRKLFEVHFTIFVEKEASTLVFQSTKANSAWITIRGDADIRGNRSPIATGVAIRLILPSWVFSLRSYMLSKFAFI